jgi:hypothetical protein
MALQAAGNGLNLILIPEKHPAGAFSMRRLGLSRFLLLSLHLFFP